MSTLQDLSKVLSRKQAILDENTAGVEKQKKSGKQTARERIAMLLDGGSFVEQSMLANDTGVVAGSGTVDGRPVYVFAQDFAVMDGAMGAKQAKKIVKVLELGAQDRYAGRRDVRQQRRARGRRCCGSGSLCGCVCAHGSPERRCADGDDGSRSVRRCGGSDGAAVRRGDRVQACRCAAGCRTAGAFFRNEEGSEGGTAGPARMSPWNTARRTLPARRKRTLLPRRRLCWRCCLPTIWRTRPFSVEEDMNRRLEGFEAGCDGRELIAAMVDTGSVLEFGKGYTDAVTALGKMAGRTTAFVYTGKGDTCDKRMKKIARFVRFADCYNIPVVSLVDSTGLKLFDTIERQMSVMNAASTLVYAYSEATTVKVTLVIGNAIGSAYVAMGGSANADMTYAWPGSVISPMTGEAAIQIMWKDKIMASKGDAVQAREELAAQYEAEVADGVNAAVEGLVDDVIDPADSRQDGHRRSGASLQQA